MIKLKTGFMYTSSDFFYSVNPIKRKTFHVNYCSPLNDIKLGPTFDIEVVSLKIVLI